MKQIQKRRKKASMKYIKAPQKTEQTIIFGQTQKRHKKVKMKYNQNSKKHNKEQQLEPKQHKLKVAHCY